jgi:Glycosyl transferase 4-like domain
MRTLYLCYFGLREPLVQTQVLPYLRQLSRSGIDVGLLTFEPNRRASWSQSEARDWCDRLQADGIGWFSLPYHKRPSLPATTYDIAVGGWMAARLVRRHGYDVVHARAHVAAAMGAIAKRLAGCRLIFDVRGFNPEEYVDAGVWPENGLNYRLAKRVERRLLAAADGFVVLTEKARDILFPGCSDTGLMRGPSIASALIHRGVWAAVGGFPDLRAAEDLIFMERVREGGFRIGWAPSATVHWHLPPSLTRVFRRFALYAKHNVWAGRQHDWHYRIAGLYLAALPFLGLAAWHTAWWLSVPLAGAAARVAKSIWRRREDRGLTWLLNPLQFAVVGGILLTIDLATFSGWLQASWWHSRRWSAATPDQATRHRRPSDRADEAQAVGRVSGTPAGCATPPPCESLSGM